MITVTILPADWLVEEKIETAPRLEQWRLRNDRITAQVYGHASIPDGHEIQTSEIIKYNSRLAHTRHSVYRLGKAKKMDCPDNCAE